MSRYKPQEWEFFGGYKGVRIDYRPGMKKRGWRIHVGPNQGSKRDGVQVFDSMSAAMLNIDKRLKKYGGGG